MTASVKTVIATVPENVPRPNRNVASSARISAGNERSTCTRKRSTARTGAGHGRLCAHSGAKPSASATPSAVPVTDIRSVASSGATIADR